MSSNGERKKPKWQRARICSTEKMPPSIPMGKLIWLSTAVLRNRAAYDYFTCVNINLTAGFVTNLELGNEPVWIGSVNVELLARDENDFADEVEMVSFEDWLKEGEQP